MTSLTGDDFLRRVTNSGRCLAFRGISTLVVRRESLSHENEPPAILVATVSRSVAAAASTPCCGPPPFLRQPGLDATNWRAELAIRFRVILRKVWGGSRTWAGARAQSVLMSVWRTCWQRGR